MNSLIAVVGQGYVGLPLAVEAAEAGYKVVGIDRNDVVVKRINDGESVIEDITSLRVSNLLNSGHYKASGDFKELLNCSIIIICVPTPLASDHKPDLSYLENAGVSVSKFLKKGDLVILESTVSPGTTRDFLMPLLEKGSGLSRNDFSLAFSPERIDPKNSKWTLKNTPKIIAGYNEEASRRGIEFYSQFVETVIDCGMLEVAETAKLLENSFRLINIAFINEFAGFCKVLGVDVEKVINAASTKPYGFMPFSPSLGVGGHCIPVDPLYLASKAREIGVATQFIDLADQLNSNLPGMVISTVSAKLGGLLEKKILVVGISYKPNISDTRESPAIKLIEGLRANGAKVDWHDELVNYWNGERSTVLSENYDLIVVATEHDYIDLSIIKNTEILSARKNNW